MAFIPFTTNRLMKPTRLYLMRHGQVKGHDEQRINGHDDVELTEEGIAQSHRLGKRLKEKGITAVCSSDLKRSLEGARIIAEYLGLKPEPPLKELREKHFGIFEGLTLREIKQRFPGELDQQLDDWIGYCPPGAESLADVVHRVVPALSRIIERHQGESVALVGHGGINRIILIHALGMKIEDVFRLEQDYGCLNILDYYPQGAVVRLVNGL